MSKSKKRKARKFARLVAREIIAELKKTRTPETNATQTPAEKQQPEPSSDVSAEVKARARVLMTWIDEARADYRKFAVAAGWDDATADYLFDAGYCVSEALRAAERWEQ